MNIKQEIEQKRQIWHFLNKIWRVIKKEKYISPCITHENGEKRSTGPKSNCLLTLRLMTPTRTCRDGMEAMSPEGGGESEPVPSRLQLVGEGSDMLVLESSSREDSPGDSSAD